MPIFATCASLAVVLARADGGETIALQGNCPTITISRSFAQPVTIDAAKARVSGLVLTGANIRWRGGTIWACTPCVKSRGYEPSDLIDGVTITGASAMHAEIKDGAATLSF